MAIHNDMQTEIKNDEYRVYVRVSTDKDEQVSSVPNQIDIARYWLETNGWEWRDSAVLKDQGISGSTLLQRPAMQSILDQAQQRQIKMVVFKSLNRLARDTKDALEIREVLTSHNVRIVSIEEGYDSFRVTRNDMSYEMSSLFAEQYSRMLSVNISGVLAAKVRRGEHIGKIPYGFDRIEGKLVIREDEAKYVRLMYEWYNQGSGYKSVVHKLNEMGIPSKTGQKWQMTSVQRLLQNPIYCGDFILNQYRNEKVAGRKKQIRNPREKWMYFKDHHPPIVDRKDWEKANSKDKTKYRKKVTPWNEFRGIIKCSECGSSMVILQSWKKKKDGTTTKWPYLKCSQYRRGGHDLCVNHKPILYKDFRFFVIDRLLKKGKKISLDFENVYEAGKDQQVREFQKKNEKLESKKENLLDLRLDKLITKQEFEEKRNEIEHEMTHNKEEIQNLQQKEHSQIHVKNITDAFQALSDEDADLYKVFAILIDEITMHPDGKIDIKYAFEG